MQTKVAERNENWMSDKPLVGRPKKDEYLLSVTACLKVRGKYCKGSSRTLVFQGLVWEPQDLLDKVERMVKRELGIRVHQKSAKLVVLI